MENRTVLQSWSLRSFVQVQRGDRSEVLSGLWAGRSDFGSWNVQGFCWGAPSADRVSSPGVQLQEKERLAIDLNRVRG